MDKYTVLLPTHNEEKRVEFVLRNFQGRARVVVLDDHSTDRTAEIAARYGATVLQRPFENRSVIHPELARWMLDQADTDYVFIAFCSMTVPAKLLDVFGRVAAEGKYLAVAHGMMNFTYDRCVERQFGFVSPSAGHFFAKQALDFSRSQIHAEWPVNVADAQRLVLPINDELCVQVYRDYDVARTELQQHRYANVEATQRFQRGERTSIFKLMTKPIIRFLYGYFWGGGFRGGIPGFLYHAWWAQMAFNVQARIWELQSGHTRPETEAVHCRMREAQLEKIK
jgi:glycosyltransferase involved in cell wall biosynthesis